MRLTRSARAWVCLTCVGAGLAPACDALSGPEADREAPELIFSSPTRDARLEGDSVVVGGLARDDRAVEEIRFRVNGGEPRAHAFEPAEQVSVDLVLRGLPLGPNRVDFEVTDAAGHSTSVTLAFTLTDATVPAILVTSPSPGLEIESDSVVVEGFAEDLRGVARVSYSVNGEEEHALPIDSGSVRVPLRFTARDLRHGANSVRLAALDATGNRGVHELTIGSTDRVAPLLTIDEPREGAVVAIPAMVRGSARDDRGIERLSYRFDGGEEVLVASGASRAVDYAFGIPTLAPGNHILELTAQDAAENRKTLRRGFFVAGANGPLAPGDLRLREVADGLAQPLHLTAPPGDDRLFVVEQGGRIRIVENGALDPVPFLDLSARVLNAQERGLLGLAFHPEYASNGYFYVHYIGTDGNTWIERYQVSADPSRADPTSRKTILTVEQPPTPLHKGGMLIFGPDRLLYIALGDGAGAADFYRHAQNPATLLGGILRIDVDGGDPYAVPPDNPRVGIDGARGELWAMGLRNPWRFSFDAQGTLFVADVGEDSWEEVNVLPATAQVAPNFGWPLMEGPECFAGGSCTPESFTSPLVQYTHEQGCSVIGGFAYRGQRIPSLRGHYLYSDFCRGFLRSFLYENGRAERTMDWEVTSPGLVTSIGEDGAGELHLTTRGGKVFVIERR